MAWTKSDFAKQIKTAYPAYQGMDDETLVRKVVEKYPVYEKQITDYSANVQEESFLTADKLSAEKFKPTFPSTSDESIIGGAAKVVGNIPSSALHFGKSLIDFFNPINTAKTIGALGGEIVGAAKEGVQGTQVLKNVPEEAYKQIVPTFLQNLFSGDIEEARRTIENDPVGQIAPLIFLAKGMANKMGKGAEFDSAMTKLASPVTKPVKAIGRGIGNILAQGAGISTGAGASSIKEGFKAASEGGKSFDTFTKAMRGEITPEETIKSAENIVETIKENRRNTYTGQLKQLGEDTTTHDISPVIKEVQTQLDKFGVKIDTEGNLDFSRSSIAKTASARADIQGVYDTIKDWGSQAGDRSGMGLDLLKKQLGDFYSESGQARAFVQGVKSKVTGILNEEVSGYKEMTSDYAKTSNLLDEIKSATGVGGKTKPDTVFTKLTTAMKQDNAFRLEILQEMEKVDPTLMNKIAGTNLASWMPKGMVGKFADWGTILGTLTGHFNPQIIPALLTTSPRIVGEFVRALGWGADKTSTVLNVINKIPEKLPLIKTNQKK